MKEGGLRCKKVKKFVVTTDYRRKEIVVDNLLNREFNFSSPNHVWAGDITCLRVGLKWHYLSVFINIFSRIVVRLQARKELKTN